MPSVSQGSRPLATWQPSHLRQAAIRLGDYGVYWPSWLCLIRSVGGLWGSFKIPSKPWPLSFNRQVGGVLN